VAAAPPAFPAASQTPNPANPFSFALANNVYLTRNYFIGAYHYVQCYASELVVPADTAEAASAVAYWYKRAQVWRCGSAGSGVPVLVCIELCVLSMRAAGVAAPTKAAAES
jgi:hypothetical protein